MPSINVKKSIGIGGKPTTGIEMNRPNPLRNAHIQIARNNTACRSIVGIIHSKMMPNPSPMPPKK